MFRSRHARSAPSVIPSPRQPARSHHRLPRSQTKESGRVDGCKYPPGLVSCSVRRAKMVAKIEDASNTRDFRTHLVVYARTVTNLEIPAVEFTFITSSQENTVFRGLPQ